LFVISLFSRSLQNTDQIFFAIVYTVGILASSSYYTAIIAALVAGTLYSFTSSLGPISLMPWVVRGATAAVFLRAFNVLAKKNPPAIATALAMTASSVITALFQFYVLVEVLRLVPEVPIQLVLFIIAFAAISTFAGSYLSTKLIARRIRPILNM
jgi:hypothetical protein